MVKIRMAMTSYRGRDLQGSFNLNAADLRLKLTWVVGCVADTSRRDELWVLQFGGTWLIVNDENNIYQERGLKEFSLVDFSRVMKELWKPEGLAGKVKKVASGWGFAKKVDTNLCHNVRCNNE